MKKVILVLFLMMLCFSVSAQHVVDYTGYDWMAWTTSDRLNYLTGYLVATNNVMDMLVYIDQLRIKNNIKENPELEEFMGATYEWSNYALTVGHLYDMIMNYYLTGGDWLKYKISEVILVVTDKAWWEWEK